MCFHDLTLSDDSDQSRPCCVSGAVWCSEQWDSDSGKMDCGSTASFGTTALVAFREAAVHGESVTDDAG